MPGLAGYTPPTIPALDHEQLHELVDGRCLEVVLIGDGVHAKRALSHHSSIHTKR
jgi:hypothetical protein